MSLEEKEEEAGVGSLGGTAAGRLDDPDTAEDTVCEIKG